MTKNVVVLLRVVGLFSAVLLAIGAFCINVKAAEVPTVAPIRKELKNPTKPQPVVYLPDGTQAKSLAEGTPWLAEIQYNQEGGVVSWTTSDSICGYAVTVDPVARVEADVAEMLDDKHLEIIEVNLVKFTDAEPWNALEPDVQSLYFAVSPWENHGKVTITWRTPGIDTNLAQGFRQKGPRCCFSLSVNNITGYLYSPEAGGEGVARSHIGFSDGTLVIDDWLTEKLDALVQTY